MRRSILDFKHTSVYFVVENALDIEDAMWPRGRTPCQFAVMTNPRGRSIDRMSGHEKRSFMAYST